MSAAPAHPRVRATIVALTIALLGGVLALAPAAGASAHDYLVSSTPSAGSTQTSALDSVEVTFNDRVLDLSGDGSSALMQVTGPDAAARHFETGCPTILDRSVSVPVNLGGAGTYRVTWQIVSADGHTVSDSIEFAYVPPAGAEAAAGRADRPRCGAQSSAAPAPTASEGATTGSAAATVSPALVLGLAGGIVALAIVGVIVVVVVARRVRRQDAGPDGTPGRGGAVRHDGVPDDDVPDDDDGVGP